MLWLSLAELYIVATRTKQGLASVVDPCNFDDGEHFTPQLPDINTEVNTNIDTRRSQKSFNLHPHCYHWEGNSLPEALSAGSWS